MSLSSKGGTLYTARGTSFQHSAFGQTQTISSTQLFPGQHNLSADPDRCMIEEDTNYLFDTAFSGQHSLSADPDRCMIKKDTDYLFNTASS